jgi:hypothetical protein
MNRHFGVHGWFGYPPVNIFLIKETLKPEHLQI